MKTNRHLAIEIFELILSGAQADKKHAAFLAARLKMDELAALKRVADEIAILAEKAYFAKGCEKRIAKRKEDESE